jgi:hypothetical protein
MPSMVRRNKIEVFMASIPGKEVMQLITYPDPRGKAIFLERLCILLKASAPDICGHRDDTRTRRLMICLGAVDNAIKASFSLDADSQSQFLEKVRTDFGDIGLMQELWVERKNSSIRITAHSICALLARHLIRKGPLKGSLEDSESNWLKTVMGKLSAMKSVPLNDPGKMDTINLDTFVYGALSLQTENLTIARATCLSETLAILMEPVRPDNGLDSQDSLIKQKEVEVEETVQPDNGLDKDIFATRMDTLIKRIERGKKKGEDKDRDSVVQKLNEIFGCLLPGGACARPPQ